MNALQQYDIQEKRLLSLWDGDQSDQDLDDLQPKAAGSGNIFDSHYIPESLLGGEATDQKYLNKGLMNMKKKTPQVTKEVQHNPFDDSMKQSLDPNASHHMILRSSQRYIDDDNNKSQNSDDLANGGNVFELL